MKSLKHLKNLKNRILTGMLIFSWLILPFSLSGAAESMTVTTEIPASLTVSVTVGEHGTAIYGGNGYTGSWQLVMDRGGAFAFELLPDRGYELAAVLCNGEDFFEKVQDGMLTLENRYYDFSVNVSFRPCDTVSVTAGVQQLSAGTAYYLPEGSWQIDDDPTVYCGNQIFYVAQDTECSVTQLDSEVAGNE